MPFDLKDLEVTRNCLERSRSPRIGLFVDETSAPLSYQKKTLMEILRYVGLRTLYRRRA